MFSLIIFDKDDDSVFEYQLEDENELLSSILESYTINDKKIEYKGRYMYLNMNGDVGTPVNSVDLPLARLNIVHDSYGSLFISNKAYLHCPVPSLKL